ncbi:CotH kinase family protein [Planctomycetota bacterium]
MINEFLADNESKVPLEPGEILDGLGESSDWMEIYNPSNRTIDVSGWYLTDDFDQKTKWQFPAEMSQLVLQPGDYLIVFASGKTHTENPTNYPYVDSDGYLHTNFRLSKDGEYLGLVDADGTTTVHAYDRIALGGNEYGYPEQRGNVSYGIYNDKPQYFAQPTPGTANTDSVAGFVDKPKVSIKGGCYEKALTVTLHCDTPDVVVRYTVDGTVPSLVNGISYADLDPIYIDRSTTLIAKSFKTGFKSSDVISQTYILLDPDAAVVNSNLPIVVIDTFGASIPNDKVNKTPAFCQAVIIDANKVTGRTSITGPEQFKGLGQIRYRGESTYGTRRHFAFEVQDVYGQDKAVSLLGMPAESDWVLTGEKLDYTFLKCEIAFKWFRDMGHYAPRQRYVEVYLNEDDGTISADDYRGIFVIREKIKRSKNRVDIARLETSHNLEPQVSGGYILKNDKFNTGDTLLKDHMEKAYYGIHYDGGGKAILADPGPQEITVPQIEWITHYLNEFHAVLWQNTTSDHYPGRDHHYTDYIDVLSWIDHGIIEQTCLDSDAFWGSYYTHKDREGKICSGPPWDFDRAFHNNGSSRSGYTEWRTNGGIFGKWHQKLQQQPEYAMMFADRWFAHRKEALSTDHTMAHIDATVALIGEAMEKSINQYGFKGVAGTYADEIALFKEWITNRLNWMDNEMARRFAEPPPIYSRPGGYIKQGSALYLLKPAKASGTIYYTLNGEDPRLAGDSIHPSAQRYHDVVPPAEVPLESLVTMSSSIWKYRYDGSNQGNAWQTLDFDDVLWKSGHGQLGLGEGDEHTDISPRFHVEGYPTAYFRHKFKASNHAGASSLRIHLLHDDGAVVYINGYEVGRIYMPSGTIFYDTYANLQGENTTTVFQNIPLSVLNDGDNILAVEVHQRTYRSDDISFDLSLETTGPIGDLNNAQIVLNKTTCIRARIKDGNTWSAQNETVYAVGPIVENLRITELMYHPVDPNIEFIELQNIGNGALNLNRVHFTDGIDFVYGDYTLEAGDHTVLVKDPVAFAACYDITGMNLVPGHYIGSLNNDGEEIVLRDALGTEIQDFNYNDAWYELTDGAGYSLTLVNPNSTEPNDWDSKSGWRPSLSPGGTPGQASETAHSIYHQ